MKMDKLYKVLATTHILKILNLTHNSEVYTCNVYLVTGNFNSLHDVNTLIDTGRDPKIVHSILEAPKGVGKKRIEQVILTHNHYDHAGLIKEIKKEFNPIICAFSSTTEGVDVILNGGEEIKIGDSFFEVIYSPGHSNDSICLYNRNEKVLFSGDTNLIINSTDGTYEKGYVDVLKKIQYLDIQKIYPGHGNIMDKECNSVIKMSLNNVLLSKIL